MRKSYEMPLCGEVERISTMADFERIEEDPYGIEKSNVLTGGSDRARYLYYQLKLSMTQATGIDLIVSFLMESGVKLIVNDLKRALERGAQVRILTGNYLGITQPSALYLLRAELGDAVDIRFYNDTGRSFHPKSYIFHYKSFSEIFIGSSNVSRSALTNGIEWNFRFSSRRDQEDYDKFYHTFQDLFEHHSIVIDDEELKKYARSWHQPAVYKDLSHYDQGASEHEKEFINVVPIFEPRGAQIEALYALEENRKEGATRALVQAATGMGKTYLAAFFSKSYSRVLFVAHRQEILAQAARSFHNVRPNDSIGFFTGDSKDTAETLIFASVESLGKAKYLSPEFFEADAFSLVVVDEFHHAVTDQYRKIISYFKPKFLLGLTATPERMDGRDIYELCDYNVPYELSLRDAINKGVLCPFHYYGIYDETDYSGLHLVRGQYAESDLDKLYIGNKNRYDLILKYYRRYGSKRALGFCSSRRHAVDMARVFCENHIEAAAVVSGTDLVDGTEKKYIEERTEALNGLRAGRFRVVFSVDMFNEGLDVPDVDMVLFLRPTQSPVVFLQQLGRGLRKAKNKPYLNVLDFIGNYQRAGNAPQLLCGDNRRTRANVGDRDDPSLYPDDCIVNFDMRLIDLFKKMQEKSRGVGERIDAEVDRIREQLDHVPSRMELMNGMDDSIYTLCLAHTAQNPFRSYMEYLHRRGWLSMEEQKIYDGMGREFLNLISTTSMTKVYKMPVLASFIGEDGMRTEVTDDEILKAWKNFFGEGTNWKDLVSGKGNVKAGKGSSYQAYLKITDAQHLANIKRNPVHFLIHSGKGMFIEKEGYAIAVRDELKDIFQNAAFERHYRDIIAYRTMDYYRRRYVASYEDAVFLFEKTVDKSLLRDGFAVPRAVIAKLLQETKTDLSRGGKVSIKVELDGRVYAAQLTSLDFGKKYQDQVKVQVRYSKDSEICQRLNEMYTEEDLKTKDKKIRVCASGAGTLRMEPQN